MSAGATKAGRRRYPGEDGHFEFLEPGDYYKHPAMHGVWIIRDPAGKLGSLQTHTVTEHEDGTITVSPSILDPAPGGWHGWLEHGVWRGVTYPPLSLKERRKRRAFYASVLPTIREVARAHGYAVAEHGSHERDFDLIAVPWVEDAADAWTLVQAVAESVKGYVPYRERPDRHGKMVLLKPKQGTFKPHGRRVWTIHFLMSQSNGYIDLGVLPRRRSRTTVVPPAT